MDALELEMTDDFRDRDQIFTDYTAELVAAYITNNHVARHELPNLIASVHASLAGLSPTAAPAPPTPEVPTQAEIRKSITPDAIISFIDGRGYKVLKRHLSMHGLDAPAYRRRYGLPVDYPMVAPSYSARRTEISRSFGLGRLKQS